MTPYQLVNSIFHKCVVSHGGKLIQGYTVDVMVDTECVSKYKSELINLISQVDKKFLVDSTEPEAGGYTMLGLTRNALGEEWFDYPTAERFVIICMAIGKAKYCFPRERWSELLGGVPYVVFNGDGIFSDDDSSSGL
ncbi:MAG: hypothetical protein ACXVCY_04505 [Pseudobdellovibrionaceae bacterium]